MSNPRHPPGVAQLPDLGDRPRVGPVRTPNPGGGSGPKPRSDRPPHGGEESDAERLDRLAGGFAQHPHPGDGGPRRLPGHRRFGHQWGGRGAPRRGAHDGRHQR
ncbi:MAG: hypothetical protein ACK55Z_28130, partial [bacterium]